MFNSVSFSLGIQTSSHISTCMDVLVLSLAVKAVKMVAFTAVQLALRAKSCNYHSWCN